MDPDPGKLKGSGYATRTSTVAKSVVILGFLLADINDTSDK